MLPVIAIVGRPNVGKSTLFNTLTQTRDAIVADVPGVTRDRQYGYGKLGPVQYVCIDTGGLVENPPRIFADDTLAVELDPSTWEVPAIMKLIQSAGVADDEMRRTFNMGLGMVIVVPHAEATNTVALLAGSRARVVGKLVPRGSGEPSRYA